MFCRARAVVPRFNREICYLQSMQVRHIGDRGRDDGGDRFEQNRGRNSGERNRSSNERSGTRFPETGNQRNMDSRYANYANTSNERSGTRFPETGNQQNMVSRYANYEITSNERSWTRFPETGNQQDMGSRYANYAYTSNERSGTRLPETRNQQNMVPRYANYENTSNERSGTRFPETGDQQDMDSRYANYANTSNERSGTRFPDTGNQQNMGSRYANYANTSNERPGTRYSEIGDQQNMSERFANDEGDGRFPKNLNLASAIEVQCDKQGYNVKLDVADYTPDQLKIKLVDDKLTVYGKHEQKEDEYGLVSREFTREFQVPETVDQDTLATSVSDEGMLEIQGDIKAEFIKTINRVIDIERPTS